MHRAWAAVPVWLVACAANSDVQFGAHDPDVPSQPGAASSGNGGASSGTLPDGGKPAPAASPRDGIKNGDETDVDCGGSSGNACADALGCAVPVDCKSGVCTAGRCAAPSPSDAVKNGDETDVDCGGSTGLQCAVGKQCAVHVDCVQGACMPGAPYGRCMAARSCRQHHGGATCGPGETDGQNQHEDCCLAIAVPRPAASGGPFELDKYLITAGRMRAFLEAVSWNPKAWILANKPAWWVESFTDMLPESKPGVLLGTLEDGASGCYAIGRGAPALWFSPDELAGTGDGPRAYTQEQMDTKVMNCFHAPLFHALCAFDGKRMPSLEDWKFAWQGGDAARKYPWGNATDFGAHAAQNFNYFWPSQPGANGDWGGYLPAPGRFPQGAGPYGHMDLGGVVENMGLKQSGNTYSGDGWFQWSFQEPTQAGHPFGQQIQGFGSGAYRPHWAVGGRCRSL